MRQIQPIREMVQATRSYAAGNFDVRMQDTGRSDEIGELAASFNNMADSLAETEHQRSEFIANISHELKTPLTAISGYAELIENKMVDGEQQLRFAGEIRKNAARLLSLINDIIQLSELDSAQAPARKAETCSRWPVWSRG